MACDKKDTVIGMVYANRIRHHDAYKFSVESSIYLSNNAPKQQGIGKQLL